jgi:hypothetical protein
MFKVILIIVPFFTACLVLSGYEEVFDRIQNFDNKLVRGILYTFYSVLLVACVIVFIGGSILAS